MKRERETKREERDRENGISLVTVTMGALFVRVE